MCPADNAPNEATECSNGSMNPIAGLKKPLLVLRSMAYHPASECQMIEGHLKSLGDKIGAEVMFVHGGSEVTIHHNIDGLVDSICQQTKAVAELAASCMAMAETFAQAMEQEAEEASEDDFPQPMSRKR